MCGLDDIKAFIDIAVDEWKKGQVLNDEAIKQAAKAATSTFKAIPKMGQLFVAPH
jgi:imidazolonepropionase-like amidohydrolase